MHTHTIINKQQVIQNHISHSISSSESSSRQTANRNELRIPLGLAMLFVTVKGSERQCPTSLAWSDSHNNSSVVLLYYAHTVGTVSKL